MNASVASDLFNTNSCAALATADAANKLHASAALM
jgi:hypothetical protein